VNHRYEGIFDVRVDLAGIGDTRTRAENLFGECDRVDAAEGGHPKAVAKRGDFVDRRV
jgi:hypothetical protein